MTGASWTATTMRATPLPPTMREAALAALASAAKQGFTDTRILDLYIRQAQVYALLAIADALAVTP